MCKHILKIVIPWLWRKDFFIGIFLFLFLGQTPYRSGSNNWKKVVVRLKLNNMNDTNQWPCLYVVWPRNRVVMSNKKMLRKKSFGHNYGITIFEICSHIVALMKSKPWICLKWQEWSIKTIPWCFAFLHHSLSTTWFKRLRFDAPLPGYLLTITAVVQAKSKCIYNIYFDNFC